MMKHTTTIKIAAQCLLKNNPVRLALVFIGFTFSVHMSAQNVNIPDANFKAILVGDNTINTDLDGEISYSEAYAYSGSIDASSQSINDLTGIEAFYSLTGLDCGFNNLTTLDLSYNVSLTFVDCSSNSLTSLNVWGLTNLTTLYCPINNLTCLDLHTNTGLTTLNCGSNNLTSLNLKNENNAILTSMNALSGGGMLYCIQVDNAAASAAAPGWQEDTWSTYNVSCGAGITVDYTHNAPVCLGTPVAFTDATSGLHNYWHWDFGDGTSSTLQNPAHTFGGGSGFWVTLISGNCNSSDTAGYTVFQGNDLTGHVTYTGGDVTNGTAILMPYVGSFGVFDTMYTSPLDASGYYTFPHVVDGNYIIKVFVDTIAYPTLIPTYYGGDWAWDSAATFTQGCFTVGTADITMYELIPNGTGPGAAAGLVLEGPSFGRAQGDPIHGVDVKLGITGSSDIVASTETDSNGVYTFNNINYGSYTVYADIPGLYRAPLHQFTIDSANTVFTNLIYLVDSVHVYPAPGIGFETYEDPNTIGVYPNPARDLSFVIFSIKSDADVKVEVYNTYGIKVQSLLDTHLSSGDYQIQFNPKNAGLKSGVYFITLNADGKRKTIRTVVME